MPDRCQCALNGVWLHQLDSAIHVQDIVELPPRLRMVTASRPDAGSHLLQRVRESLSVQVNLTIEAYDIKARQALLHRVISWAERGGMLSLGSKAGRQLPVVCTQLPTCSALAWLDTLSVTFTAYDTPYWQDDTPTAFTTTGHCTLSVPGTAPDTPLDLTINNVSGDALTSLTIQAAGTLSFTGLSIAPGEALRIHHDAGVFGAEMTSSGVALSALSCRSMSSSDDLLLLPGRDNALTITANTAISATGAYRGRYLS